MDWQHNRLLVEAAATAGVSDEHQTASTNDPEQNHHDLSSEPGDVAASVGKAAGEDGAEGGVASRAGWGTYVAFASHANARAARGFLAETFSAASLATVAHDRQNGACFLVHANAAAVDALLLSVSRREDEELGVGEESGGRRPAKAGAEARGDRGALLLDAFVALPPTLKIAPSMLDHSGFVVAAEKTAVAQEASAAAETRRRNGDRRNGEGNGLDGKHGDHDDVLTTKPGRAVHQGGLVIFLSPGSVTAGDELITAKRWSREWGSPEIDLHSLSFWSDPNDGAAPATLATTKHPPVRANDAESRRAPEAGDGRSVWGEDDVYAAAAMHVREWLGAARVVHSLADGAGVTPAQACGWDAVKVASEGPGFMTIRGECCPYAMCCAACVCVRHWGVFRGYVCLCCALQEQYAMHSCVRQPLAVVVPRIARTCNYLYSVGTDPCGVLAEYSQLP